MKNGSGVMISFRQEQLMLPIKESELSWMINTIN